MIVRPARHWGVYYRNASGILRCHKYWTRYHAEQFARAMKGYVTEIEIVELSD